MRQFGLFLDTVHKALWLAPNPKKIKYIHAWRDLFLTMLSIMKANPNWSFGTKKLENWQEQQLCYIIWIFAPKTVISCNLNFDA